MIEAVVAAAVVTIALGATLSAILAANARFGPDPARVALDAALHREMSVARDLLKYQSSTLSPRSVATSIPLPDGSPLPATLQMQTTSLPGGGVQIALSASAVWKGVTQTLALTSTIAAPLPLPGSSVTLPGLAPAPTGAP